MLAAPARKRAWPWEPWHGVTQQSVDDPCVPYGNKPQCPNMGMALMFDFYTCARACHIYYMVKGHAYHIWLKGHASYYVLGKGYGYAAPAFCTKVILVPHSEGNPK